MSDSEQPSARKPDDSSAAADWTLPALLLTLLIGLIWQGWSHRRFAPEVHATEPPTVHATAAPPADDDADAAIQTVVAYIRASVDAAHAGSPELLAPFLDPASALSERIAVEFRRRRADGEQRVVQLERLAVERSVVVDDDDAYVLTVEQWRWEVRRPQSPPTGHRATSRYRYTLRRVERRWVIVDVQETLIMRESLPATSR